MAIMTNMRVSRAGEINLSQEVLDMLIEAAANSVSRIEENLQSTEEILQLLDSEEPVASGFVKNNSKEIIYSLSNNADDKSKGYVQIKGNNLPTFRENSWTEITKLPSFSNITYRNDYLDGQTISVNGMLDFSTYKYKGEEYQLSRAKLDSIMVGDDNLKITILGNVGIQQRPAKPDEGYWPEPVVTGAINSIQLDLKKSEGKYYRGKVDLSLGTKGVLIKSLEILEDGGAYPLLSLRNLNMRINDNGEFVDSLGKAIQGTAWEAAFSGNDKITGTSEDDVLDGGRGNDLINGGAGSDVLYGGLGNDQITGGSGSDVFVFEHLPQFRLNADVITDFYTSTKPDRFGLSDSLLFDSAVFENQDFVKVKKIKDKVSAEGEELNGEGFIYEASTGSLFYDIDGAGQGAVPIQLVRLVGKPDLTELDISFT